MSYLRTNNLCQILKENKTIKIPNEGIYEGEIENGIRHGKGKMSYKNGSSYDGEWESDNFHGQGTYLNDTGSFMGQWENGGLRKGTLIWSSGDKYVGECWCGVPHGNGSYFFRNGDEYNGDWDNYAKEGQGIFTWANGDYYIGNWVDNEFHGKGLLFKSGIKKQGTWERGKFIN